MVITDAPGKPKAIGHLKCTFCGCVHRLSDLKTVSNCPSCGGNLPVAVGSNEPFDFKTSVRRRKAYLQAMSWALGLPLHRDSCGTNSSGPL